MRVTTLRRYPVKSMLGETVAQLDVDERGAGGDRELALIDVETGRVATAKHPRLWRALLGFTAIGAPGGVRITLPDGVQVAAEAEDIDARLSELLGRRVHLASERPEGAQIERPAPEDVLEHGVDAEVEYVTLEISKGTPGRKFVDLAPLHLITTATCEHIGADVIRYRPNLVVSPRDGFPAYGENDWVGRQLRIGEVTVRATRPTPRCAVPTLEHGELGRMPDAVRRPMAENRLEWDGAGAAPCAGVFLEVLTPGVIRTGDPVELR